MKTLSANIITVAIQLGMTRLLFIFFSSRTSDGQSNLADKCCSPLQICEAAVELLGLQGWLGPGPHSQFFIQLTPL